ncbi:MAG: hypothetical protein ACD_76C00149G0008 [uncultured bacterium]|nr:MAG: hypothetical protein ACD_76C00149G0008 [uncultured bacterium]HBD05717.1 replicative DNA helicase [Candidatus Uhrbacteria bacterium]
MTNKAERVPPQNLEAEQSVLGAILIDPESIIKVSDIIHPDDFYLEKHKQIYDTILELSEKNQPIDMISVSNKLEEKGSLKEAGGRSYLADLTNAVTTAANISSHAEIVRKKATLRRLMNAAGEIGELAGHEDDDVDKLLDEAEQHLFGISQSYLKRTFVLIKNVLQEAFERIDELHRERGKLRGIPTGYVELDNLLGGLQKSDLVVLAARPSVGKTSLALDIARNVGVKAKIPIALFSLEMSKEQLVDRMISAEANVDLWKLRTGNLSDREDDFPRIGHALGVLSEAPIYIDDTPGNTVLQIRTKARRLHSEHGLGLIIIDYLQLMESRKSIDNRVQEVAEMTRALKQVARELDVPVLALSQLSRAVEMSKPAIPKLSHLRESGSIEQDADVVLFIYRKTADRSYAYEDIPIEERSIAEIHIAKHRNGPTGMVKLFFDQQRASFKNLEQKPAKPNAQVPASNTQQNQNAPF